MLKSSSGLELEKKQSLHFHQTGLALLISPQLLRSRGLGQIDLSRMIKKNNVWKIEIAEVKSSKLGYLAWNRQQRERQWGVQGFLGQVFGYSVQLIHLIGDKRS